MLSRCFNVTTCKKCVGTTLRCSLKSLYSFKSYTTNMRKILSWQLSCRRHVKAEDICTDFLCTHIAHISELQWGKRKVTRKKKKMDRRMDGIGKVRWRLDGYLQTENMEEKPRVLASWRPPWKKRRDGEKKTERRLLMIERDREEILRLLWQKKSAVSRKADCRAWDGFILQLPFRQTSCSHLCLVNNLNCLNECLPRCKCTTSNSHDDEFI